MPCASSAPPRAPLGRARLGVERAGSRRLATAAGDRPNAVANPRGIALLGVLVSLVLVAGCGSSSKSGPTKKEFVASADAICTAAAKVTAPLIAKLEASGAALATGSAKAARELAPVLAKLHEEGASSLARLRALKRPAGEKAAIERFLSPLTDVVSAAGQAASSVAAGQGSAAIGLLAQVESDAQQATSAASSYGVAPCGSVVSAIG